MGWHGTRPARQLRVGQPVEPFTLAVGRVADAYLPIARTRKSSLEDTPGPAANAHHFLSRAHARARAAEAERLPPSDDDQTGAWCHGRRGYRASMREVLPGVFHWTTLHPRIQSDVSSYWLDRAGVAIDPLVPSEHGLEWFSERTSSPKAVLLSNRHHYRDSARFVDAFGCSVHCNPPASTSSATARPSRGSNQGTRCPVACWLVR